MPTIYCIEGHWDYGGPEPNVINTLAQAVQGAGQWDYIWRNSATINEMRFWLQNEWENCDYGSILYIASHGEPGHIWLSEQEGASLYILSGLIGNNFAQNCLVHFGGCNVLDVPDEQIDNFLTQSGASAVSGYTNESGWHDPPNLALELTYFGRICEQGINLGHHMAVGAGLPPLVAGLDENFPECGFCLRSRWDRQV